MLPSASAARFSARGGVGAVAGYLPAYNRSLNVAFYARGAFYRLSPWLAARCSGLPDAYQHVASKRRLVEGAAAPPSHCDAAAALANMVSPLQARELGYGLRSRTRVGRARAAAAGRQSTRCPFCISMSCVTAQDSALRALQDQVSVRARATRSRQRAHSRSARCRCRAVAA